MSSDSPTPGAPVAILARRGSLGMTGWLALGERTVVASGATADDTGVIHGRAGEQDGAAVALLARQTRRHMVRRFA